MKLKTKLSTMLDLIRHEGYMDTVYLDSEDLPTVGVGHLIKDSDPEFNLEVGTQVSDTRIEELFLRDVDEAIDNAMVLVALNKHPEDVQSIIVNMAFNLGFFRLRGFKRMLRALELFDYEAAAREMQDSKWYKQVRRRSVELVSRMEQSKPLKGSN